MNKQLKVIAAIFRIYDLIASLFEYVFLRGSFRYFRNVLGVPIEAIISENVAIYHVYAKNLTKDRVDYVDFLISLGFHVIISSAMEIDRSSIDSLPKNNCSVYIKKNVGRDFHSYKRFSTLIESHNVLFTNDSMYFMKSISGSFRERFLNAIDDVSKDVVALTMNFQARSHLGGFFLYVKRESKAANQIKSYLSNYLPLSCRWWSIAYGECGVSEGIIKTQMNKCKILYSIDYITSFVNDCISAKNKWLLDLLETAAIQSALQDIDISTKLNAVVDFPSQTRHAQILSLVETRNPTHWGSLYLLACGMPFLKKDILKVHTHLPLSSILQILVLLGIDEGEYKELVNVLYSIGYKTSYKHKSLYYRIINEVY